MAARKPGELTAKQERFVNEYLVDCNGTQAATRAGFSAKTANEQAARMLADVSIKAKIDAGLAKLAQKTQIDAQWIRDRLKENVERSMQREPVYNYKGEPTGEYRYEGNVANRALELLGKDKAVSMFDDVTKNITLDVTKMSGNERQARINELMGKK